MKEKENDDVNLLREDLIKQIWELYKMPLPYPASGSSTGQSLGSLYKKFTLRGGAGGASGAATTPLTTMVASSGTAGSATSAIPPEWYTQKWPRDVRNFKAHLKEEGSIKALCGQERRMEPLRGKPHPARMCNTCMKVFKKNVLEGRYAR